MISFLPNISLLKIFGLATMTIGPWFLIYRYFYLRLSYNELIVGSLVFLLAGSFLWFMGGDED